MTRLKNISKKGCIFCLFDLSLINTDFNTSRDDLNSILNHLIDWFSFGRFFMQEKKKPCLHSSVLATQSRIIYGTKEGAVMSRETAAVVLLKSKRTNSYRNYQNRSKGGAFVLICCHLSVARSQSPAGCCPALPECISSRGNNYSIQSSRTSCR